MYKNRKLMMLLASALILCLLISAGLTSCGGADEDDAPETEIEETEQEDEADDAADDAEDVLDDIDLDEVPTYDESDMISEDEALKAAVTDAGLDENAAEEPIIELDAGDEPTYYVNFVSGDKEYDYTIDAINGEVLSKEVY